MVNDNMRNYQLSREESSKEVVEHLQSEGEDLSVIFIANNEEDYEKGLKLSEALATIQKAAEGKETLINAMFAMQTVRTTCQSNTLGDMAKTWFGSRDGLQFLSVLLKPSDDEDEEEEETDEEDDKTTEFTSILRTIVSASQNHHRNLSHIKPDFFENLLLCLEDNVFEVAVVSNTMEVIKTCCGSEYPESKAAFFENDGLAITETSLKAHSSRVDVQRATCEAIQTLLEGMPGDLKTTIMKGMTSMLITLVKKNLNENPDIAEISAKCLKILGSTEDLLSEICASSELDIVMLQEKMSSINV